MADAKLTKKEIDELRDRLEQEHAELDEQLTTIEDIVVRGDPVGSVR